MVPTASDSCFGGVCMGHAPLAVDRCSLGVERCWSLRCGMPLLHVRPGARRCVIFPCATVPVLSPSWPMGGFLLPCCVAPAALSLWAPACHFGPFLALLSGYPFPPLALPLIVPLPFPVWWPWGGGGGLWGADGPGLGVGGLEPLAEGWRGVGGAEALDLVLEEGFPCRLRHGGLRGGLVGVDGGAGADLLEGVHHVHPFSHSRSPGPLHPAAELPQGGGTPPGKVDGGPGGGGGSQLEILELREEEVDTGRRWWAWRRLGEQERRWRRLGVEDAYKRRGEREARWGSWGEEDRDMGRRWLAWRRPGEQERRWRGLGMEDAYRRRGERHARCCSWGEGDVDTGRRWRAWWPSRERERREPGAGGLWWRLGSCVNQYSLHAPTTINLPCS